MLDLSFTDKEFFVIDFFPPCTFLYKVRFYKTGIPHIMKYKIYYISKSYRTSSSIFKKSSRRYK